MIPIAPVMIPFYSSRQKRLEEEKKFQESNQSGIKEDAMPNITCRAALHNKEIEFSFSPEFFKDQPELCLKLVKEQLAKLIPQEAAK